MTENPYIVMIAVFVWMVSGLAGTQLIQAAFKGLYPPRRSRIGAIIQDILFRFRFVAGIMLIVYVLAGIWRLLK